MPSLRRAALATVLFTALSAYTERPAFANGRFPRAQTVLERGDLLLLRATFGVLLSHDRGLHFDWICEQAIGFSGAWDPPLAIGDDGAIYFGLEKGLRSTKDGCAFHEHAELAGQLVSDLTEFHGEVWAATSTPNTSAFVWRTQGGVFRKRSKPLPGLYVDTLDVYRGKLGSEPGRVYLTAIEPGKAIAPHFYRSDDGGVSFQELHPTWPAAVSAGSRLFIAAIGATSSDRVFVRALGTAGSDLLLTEDGGATFRVVLHFDGAMFGFAIDGDEVWAGSGTSTEGLHRSTDGGKTFAKVRDQVVYCLRAGTSLFACSEPYAPGGYALAASHDHGTTFASLGTFASVRGPVTCATGDGTKCVEPWSQTKLMLSTDVQTTPVDAGVTDATTSEAASGTRPAPSKCGCELVGDASSDATAALFGALLALGLLVRRGSSMTHRRCPSDSVRYPPTR